MFIPFVVMPFFGAFALQAILFIKAQNLIVRFAPTALGVFGLLSCVLFSFVATFMRVDSASVVAENQAFAWFMALPFACALLGGLAALGYVFVLQNIEKGCGRNGNAD